MEGEPEAEPGAGEQLEHQRQRAEDEWKLWQGGQVRNTLHLVSAVAQWILLLACLIYLGLHFLRPSKTQSDKVLWTHILYTGESTEGAAVNLTAELGPIQVRNGSILVPCDGLYLVSLRSSIFLQRAGLELKLSLQVTQKTIRRVPWEETFQGNESRVNLSTVLYLFEQDSITLWTSSNASISDLTFSLVLVGENKS
ncbi:tumor necrosis factor ligand superfamily member 4 [Vidua chalybeata]|uniref:tumor necrosis factor ligand superfamily member 4 n=1 Tax=Vidua chalybeata TaxID=81927 RepID=UPI0023A83B9A|nr:tumor necrosis factor ligand superfamily member 4 [Vidua chalybeata]